ncbi:hypothetical protein B296_00008108 [Ensete ventricosum]|uniref:Uncharacterized protein n=1 Tax=Ensete ventricosum TaxID=4639 RepID=A0A427A004_ENSVE|nr:hypothetical protein B296_00008108 [Ensete ventricosum]
MHQSANQGSLFRPVPLGMGGTYRSNKIPVREPPTIERYHRNRPSAVDFNRRWSIKGERRRGRRRKGRKERYTSSSLVFHAIRRSRVILRRQPSFSALGDEARKEKGIPCAGTRQHLGSPHGEKGERGDASSLRFYFFNI